MQIIQQLSQYRQSAIVAKNLSQAGQDHLSHRLIRAGLSRKQAALSLWMLSALYGVMAIFISRVDLIVEKYLVAAGLSLWVFLFILFFKQKDS